MKTARYVFSVFQAGSSSKPFVPILLSNPRRPDLGFIPTTTFGVFPHVTASCFRGLPYILVGVQGVLRELVLRVNYPSEEFTLTLP